VQRLVAAREARDRDLLVALVRIRGCARPVVDRVEPLLCELRDRCPRLLRGDVRHETAQGVGERVRECGRRGGSVAQHLELAARNEVAQARLRLLSCAPGRVAEVELGRRTVRDDVRRDPALDADRAYDLPEDEPVELDVERLPSYERLQAVHELVDRVHARPRPRRVRALPAEGDAGLDVPEAPGVEDAVRRLEHDGEPGSGQRIRPEERGERAVDDRNLLAREEEVAPRHAGEEELEHHSDTALHVARTEPVHRARLDATRDVALRGHRVEMAGEYDRRGRIAVEQHLAVVVERLGSHDLAHEGDERCLGAALGGHVDELKRSGGEVWEPHGRRHNDRQMAETEADPTPGLEPERGFVLAVLAQGVDPDDELAELEELARTAGVEPVGRLVQHRPQPDPRSFVGKGKLDELKQAYANADAEVLLVDDELSPSQQRTLENTLQARVVDRAELILDIFAQHAVSAEGKLQVELAQLEYNLPRMRGMWQHLERLGGGVGTRGPGESQLETDRRIARRRVSILRDRLKDLRRQRDVRRKERRRTEIPTVALAGYTNVGKSTLLNTLTDASVPVRNRLFETLDPTTRGFEHEGRRYLVTDTVGFVRRLPHQLVEGFAATLEETLVADLVLHVVDGSAPEERLVEQVAAVDAVLHEIGADELPLELVINKIDEVDSLHRRRLGNRYPGALQVSALTGEGLEALRERIADRFAERFESVRLLLPYDEGGKLNELYALGAPIEQREDTSDGVLVVARLPRREIRRFARYLVAEAEHGQATGA
jgi:GTPase